MDRHRLPDLIMKYVGNNAKDDPSKDFSNVMGHE
jgi:hypothetical protein